MKACYNNKFHLIFLINNERITVNNTVRNIPFHSIKQLKLENLNDELNIDLLENPM